MCVKIFRLDAGGGKHLFFSHIYTVFDIWPRDQSSVCALIPGILASCVKRGYSFATQMPGNKWSLGLCDCCSYRDLDGKCWFFPTFFPQALCGACCIDGEIHTIMNEEKECCCRMSTGGICRCLMEIPIGLLGPFGGIVLSLCCGVKTRHEVISLYEINDEGSTCCNSCLGTSVDIYFIPLTYI